MTRARHCAGESGRIFHRFSASMADRGNVAAGWDSRLRSGQSRSMAGASWLRSVRGVNQVQDRSATRQDVTAGGWNSARQNRHGAAGPQRFIMLIYAVLSKGVALLTILTCSRRLSAAACLLDCRVAPTTQAATSDPPVACHAAASAESGGTHVGSAPANCHRDHEVQTADVAPLSVRRANVATGVMPRSLEACELALDVRGGSSSSEPISFRLNPTSALPLRI